MARRQPQGVSPLYRYRFGAAEFDEARLELRVGGVAVELEQRPLQVLAELLRYPDEVVTRDELFETVWAGRPTVDNVLANAVAKLRKALGETEGARVTTLPRIGYRIAGPVERHAVGRKLDSQLELRPGTPVPGREHFLFEAQLNPAHNSEVWLARHVKTHEPRVYKFSPDGEHLAMLKREATLYRVLVESLGERDDLTRILDWNFETPPFFLECEYGGRDLKAWATDHLAALSVDARLALFLQIADAVAAAHSVGVLHKDLKPANVLVAPRSPAANGLGWQVRITDFGSGRLLDPARLAELGITQLGLTVTQNIGSDSSIGTPLYLAPELLAGLAPTVQSDLFALGLMLYQLIVGDLQRPMASGWEQDVPDALIREDIAAATDGTPARRLANVAELTERLRTREARRAERSRLLDIEARATAAERLLERAQARRPWVMAAATVLVAGLALSLWFFLRAERAAAVATATNRFLNEDLLGAGIGGSTAWYEKNPSLREILDLARTKLEGRFGNEPATQAGIRMTLGRAYRSLGDFVGAEAQLRVGADRLHAVYGLEDERSVLADYELAGVLARLSRFKEAGERLDAADTAAGERLDRKTEIALRARLARGGLNYQQLLPKPALASYEAAEPLQQALHPDDAALSAHIRLSIAGCYLRLGRAGEAETIARKVLSGEPYTEERIGRTPLALARRHLAHALRVQGRYPEALPVLEQAVADLEKTLGPNDQMTIGALSDLGYIYSLLNQTGKALEIQREVYGRSVKRWGSDSQFTLIELLNLGDAESELKDRDSALTHLTEAERGLVKVSGERSPVVQSARYSLAQVLSDLGRKEEALALVERIDPEAFSAAATQRGAKAKLKALRGRLMIDTGNAGAGLPVLQEALEEMARDGVALDEIGPFKEILQKAILRQR